MFSLATMYAFCHYLTGKIIRTTMHNVVFTILGFNNVTSSLLILILGRVLFQDLFSHFLTRLSDSRTAHPALNPCLSVVPVCPRWIMFSSITSVYCVSVHSVSVDEALVDQLHQTVKQSHCSPGLHTMAEFLDVLLPYIPVSACKQLFALYARQVVRYLCFSLFTFCIQQLGGVAVVSD